MDIIKTLKHTDPIYKIQISDRNYVNWTILKVIDFKEKELKEICPSEKKLFNNDVFSYCEISTMFTLLHSSIRITKNVPGVLLVKGNKTYGRHKNGKLLYKCIPDDVRLPTFLVPYEMKHVGFSKVFINQYITFNFTEWTEKHPYATISQLIGPIEILDNFYEYQLYCKSLNASIQKFTKNTTSSLSINNTHNDFIEKICIKYPEIEDRTSHQVFTIDPQNSLDFDDAFSIVKEKKGDCFILSIYIANVTIWMDVLNLWDSFSRRISTIYLPDRKRPMLPTILSDCLCSLQSNNVRLAFVMDLTIDASFTIIDIKYSNCKICVYKNYYYEEPDLLKNKNYTTLFDVVKKISRTYKYINNIRNSHDIVCYLMILMNYNTAKKLLVCRNGIFRSTIINKVIDIPECLPEEVTNFIKIWNSSSGQYIDLSLIKENESIAHDLLEMDAYIHITSPIRRIVDLLNIIKFQQNTGLIKLSENAYTFYNNWIAEIDYINTTMRSIRKVQNDCSLLHLCSTDPEIILKIYNGYLFDKIVRNDGLFQYVVYLPEIKLVSKLTLREEYQNYETKQFKLYLFYDEERFKKKIRIQII
jgi:exoribonuclease R